jgi:hypothetical protein
MDVKSSEEFSSVQFEGLNAFTDTYAVEGETLMFLSLFGSRVSVRAIWSALLAGNCVNLGNGTLKLDTKVKWRVLQKLTPSGVLHAVCLPECLEIGKAQDGFLVLGQTQEDIERRFFLYLDRLSVTPISREWGSWILRKALAEGFAEWLKSQNIFALRYRHKEAWLEDLITSSLKKRHKIAV